MSESILCGGPTGSAAEQKEAAQPSLVDTVIGPLFDNELQHYTPTDPLTRSWFQTLVRQRCATLGIPYADLLAEYEGELRIFGQQGPFPEGTHKVTGGTHVTVSGSADPTDYHIKLVGGHLHFSHEAVRTTISRYDTTVDGFARLEYWELNYLNDERAYLLSNDLAWQEGEEAQTLYFPIPRFAAHLFVVRGTGLDIRTEYAETHTSRTNITAQIDELFFRPSHWG